MKHHSVVWAIVVDGYVELYAMHPFEPDAERLADIRLSDFTEYTGLNLSGITEPVRVRLRGQRAKNR